MTTLLPKDADNNVIPALRLKNGGAHIITVSATPTRNTQAFSEDTKVVSVYTTQPTFVAFGDATISATASDHYIPAGVYYDIAIASGGGKGPHHDYLSVLAAASDGVLYISEKE